MARTTFQGLMRSFSGASKESGVTPGVVTQSVMISFDPTISAGSPAAVRIGTSSSAGLRFTLPAGAVPISFTSLGGGTGGTSPTVDIGTLADVDGFFNEADADTKGVITGANGALVVAGGITAPVLVYASVGSSAATGGTTSGIFTYTVIDDATESN
jgi:hypothetical protein